MLQNRQRPFGSGNQSRSTGVSCQRIPYVRVAPAGAAPAVAAPAGAAAASSSRDMPDSVAAVRQMIAARGLDPDPDLVSQEAHLAFTYLSSPQQQQGTLPPRVQDAAQLAGLALMLTDLMATGSTYRTLQMLKRHPGLLQLQPSEVGMRLIGWASAVRQLGKQAPGVGDPARATERLARAGGSQWLLRLSSICIARHGSRHTRQYQPPCCPSACCCPGCAASAAAEAADANSRHLTAAVPGEGAAVCATGLMPHSWVLVLS
jgi:hypothetical protein